MLGEMRRSRIARPGEWVLRGDLAGRAGRIGRAGRVDLVGRAGGVGPAPA